MIGKEEARQMSDNKMEQGCICKTSSVKGCTAFNCTFPYYPTYPDPYPHVPQTPLPNIPWYPNTTTTTKLTMTGKSVSTPELYQDDLETLKHLMARLDMLGNLEGVHEVEIYVKLFDGASWAVVGYGESGDPCVLRFEER